MTGNTAQAFDWNGNSGERWLANQERLDRMLAAYGDAAVAAAAPRPGEQVLDIGCGAGATTLDIARLVRPDGFVLGVDISGQLIGRACECAGEGAGVAFLLADASREAFAPSRFDLLFSRFGVMFFDDPVAAFAHLRRALKPTGRLAFICWRGAAENDWTRLPMAAIRGVVPPAPPTDPEAPGPFSFGDRDRVTHILTDAGYGDIAFEAVDHPILFGLGSTREAAIDDAVDHALQVGPLGRALTDQPDDVQVRAIAAVRAAFAQKVESDGVRIEGAAWVVTAQRAE
ncbi:class I SAM-dependent methyltransferase [Sphingobium aromaticiconvertens]|uniref:class I SAM-dependent methyltransferase n=1 Tax=Sphingobium aromaticiconvertens TaxID=365341 RepID=UPI00301A56B0